MGLRNLSIWFFLVFAFQGCGGGGGGGSTTQNSVGTGTTGSTSSSSTSSSSSSSSSSTTTYSYDPIDADYSNKVWGTVTIGRFLDDDQQYLTDYSDDVIFDLTEYSNAIDLGYRGTKKYDGATIDHSWSLTENNATATVLYDPLNPSAQMSIAIRQSFTNVDVGILTYDLDYLANKNIRYTDLALTEIDWKDGSRKDSFVSAYGDNTQAGDFPTSGTEVYNLDTYLMLEYWDNQGARQRVFASGDGQISVNFSNNTVSGSFEIRSYYDWDLWLIGGTDISQIFGIDTVTLNVANTSISNGDFIANVSIQHDSSDGTVFAGAGSLQGSLFGPDAGEMGVVYYLFEDPNVDTQDVFAWDSFGSAIGQ